MSDIYDYADRCENEISTLISEIEKLTTERDSLRAELEHLNRQLADERSGDCDKDKTIRQLKGELLGVRGSHHVLMVECEALRADNAKEQATVDSLLAQTKEQHATLADQSILIKELVEVLEKISNPRLESCDHQAIARNALDKFREKL